MLEEEEEEVGGCGGRDARLCTNRMNDCIKEDGVVVLVLILVCGSVLRVGSVVYLWAGPDGW